MKMTHKTLTVLVTLLSIVSFSCAETLNTDKFPDGFLIGVATAAYQIEGAWNEDGKGENIWDNLTHSRPELIADRSSGDVACDSYHHLEDDIEMIKNLGVDFYRFSLSWSRILPKGYSYQVNSAAIDYYNRLINALIDAGVEPVVTLYHWDLPQVLQNLGGWPNELMVDYFEDYARVAFENFGDRVKTWITFNEPINTCYQGYGNVLKAPALNITGFADYLCTHTVLKSHARVYHVYDEEFRATQNGKISITLDTMFYEPYTNTSSDIAAADRALQFSLGWFAHAIYSESGDYPAVMKEIIANRSELEGFSESRLPAFTADEIEYVKGTYDYFGLNVYTTRYVKAKDYGIREDTHWVYDSGFEAIIDDNWDSAASDWLKVVPWGFRKLLNWVKTQYGDVDIYITENGYSDFGEVDDKERIVYLELYMSAMLDAIYEDNVSVKAYTIWSLMDNFEWLEGYTHYFGLYKVDFTSENRTRSEKKSVGVIKEIIANRQLPAETYTDDGDVDDESGANSIKASILFITIFTLYLFMFF